MEADKVPKLSVCLIVKNEEKFIADCLKSVMPVASEIIIMDTGSTDSTREIINQIRSEKPDNVSRFVLNEIKWDDDFARARNQAIAKAKGDWILNIDADEILLEESRNELLPFLKKQPYQDIPVIFGFKILDPVIEYQGYKIHYKSILFRNGFNIRFISAIHEFPALEDKRLKEIDCSFLQILHQGNYKEKINLGQKSEYYEKLLLNAINKQDRYNLKYYYYFHLGFHYYSYRQYDKALDYLRKSYKLYNQLKLSKNSPSYPNIIFHLIKALSKNEKYLEAMEYLKEIRAILPLLPDNLYYSGLCNMGINKFDQAIKEFEEALKLFEKSHEEVNPLDILSDGPIIYPSILLELSRCYFIKEDFQKELLYLNKAEEAQPNKKIKYFLMKYYLLRYDLEKASEYYISLDPDFSYQKKIMLKNILRQSPYHNDYRMALRELFNNLLENSKFLFNKFETQAILKAKKDIFL